MQMRLEIESALAAWIVHLRMAKRLLVDTVLRIKYQRDESYRECTEDICTIDVRLPMAGTKIYCPVVGSRTSCRPTGGRGICIGSTVTISE